MTLSRRNLLAATLASTPFLSPQARAAGELMSLFRGKEKPLVLDAEADLAALQKAAFQKSSAMESVRSEPQKLAIAAFQLRFITDSGLTKERGKASASVEYKLDAPPPDVYQRITDDMRTRLEAELAARGWPVLPVSALLADPEFAKRAADAPRVVDSGPNAWSRNGYIDVNAANAVDTFGVMGGAFEAKLAERLGGGIGLLKVQLRVDFASLEALGLFEGGGAAGVKGSVGLSLSTDGGGFSSNGITLVTPAGGYPDSLLKPVYLKQPFAKAVEKIEQSTSQAVSGFLLSLAGGSSAANRFLVKPADDYEAQMKDAGALVARLLAATLPSKGAPLPPPAPASAP